MRNMGRFPTFATQKSRKDGARKIGLITLAMWMSGCGYHTLGAATHLPANMLTLSVPLFAPRTEPYHTEALMTTAVIREFAARTSLRVAPDSGAGSDAVLHGTILT